MKINDPRVILENDRYFVPSKGPKPNEYVRGICDQCSERCLVLKYRYIKDRRVYCSNTCRGKSWSGAGNSNWKGGKSIDSNGYVTIKPYIDGKRREFKEHRLVMEKHLGRPLLSTETVHHVNGDSTDNRLENLELWSNRHPKGQRVTELVEWAKEILAIYG